MLQPYMYEPTLSEDEIEKRRLDQIQLADDTSGRAGSLHWCLCKNCVPMIDDLQSKCCHEDPKITTTREENDCITLKDAFERTILNEDVVLLFRQEVMMYAKNTEIRNSMKEDSNATKRFLAYRTFIRWINAGHSLGLKNRVVIPSCVLHAIRETWPEEDNIYVGFKPPVEGFPV
jgi:hypothetical protein